jgi:hypothetical protein
VVVQNALTALRSSTSHKAWYVFEGPTYPDAYVVTPDLLLVVEGKRTEPSATTSTTWMPERHQIWRHIDAAWEIRGRRDVAGLLVVEADPNGKLPELWIEASRQTCSSSVLNGSFPHRSLEERAAIAASFRGLTTWAAICEHFGLDHNILRDNHQTA